MNPIADNLAARPADGWAARIAAMISTVDWKLVFFLSIAPVFRELIMGILFPGHDIPFGTSEDIVHNLLEVGFMFAIGVGISRIRLSRRAVIRQKDFLEKMVADRTEEIRLTQQTSIEALATLSEYHDTDTGDHIRRIRGFVRILARWLKKHSAYGDYLNQRPDYVEDLSLAAILHDIGKNAVPEAVLAKPGRLTTDEFDLMKTHTSIAGAIFKKANQRFIDRFGKDSYLALARDIAHYHHERWDGTGYPQGLRGEEIPLSARIVALADVYDALTSKRPYKAPWSHEDAAKEIARGSGTQFDPTVVDAFLANEKFFRKIHQSFANKDSA
jgi:response regulator RpfG family c-di-GMP phosphodiesterase